MIFMAFYVTAVFFFSDNFYEQVYKYCYPNLLLCIQMPIIEIEFGIICMLTIYD